MRCIKSIITILLATLTVSFNYAQFPTLWKTGKTKEINGYSILREEGAGRSTPYIYFTDQETLINDAIEDAESEMWTQDKKETRLAVLSSTSGLLHFQVVGSTIEEGNTKHFSIIIQSLSGEELFRKRLDSSVPDYAVTDYGTFWTNYDLVFIPLDAAPPFRVFAINHYQTDVKYKKKVYLVQKEDDTNKYNTNKSPDDAEENVVTQFEINEIVWLVLEGEKVEAKVIASSGSRYRVEFLNNKGKTKSATVSDSNLTKKD
jgi:hypothetical protein